MVNNLREENSRLMIKLLDSQKLVKQFIKDNVDQADTVQLDKFAQNCGLIVENNNRQGTSIVASLKEKNDLLKSLREHVSRAEANANEFRLKLRMAGML